MWCAVGKCLSRLSSSSGGSSGATGSGSGGRGLVSSTIIIIIPMLSQLHVFRRNLAQGTPKQQREGALLAYERAVQCDDREVLSRICTPCYMTFRNTSCCALKGVATRELARMHREIGNIAQAAACFKNYLAIQDSSNGQLTQKRFSHFS